VQLASDRELISRNGSPEKFRAHCHEDTTEWTRPRKEHATAVHASDWRYHLRWSRDTRVVATQRGIPRLRGATTVVRPSIKANGLFSENGDAQIWFSDDASRIPVQVKTKFSKFSLTLSLQSVTQGDAAAHERLLASAPDARR